MIAVFSQNQTPRLEYMLDHIIAGIWGQSYRIFLSEKEFLEEAAVAKINYSPDEIDGTLQIVPDGLLFETAIRKQEPHVEWSDGMPVCLFQNTNREKTVWDPLSACFYFLSRYEEYLPHTADKHGRYPAQKSMAAQNGFLQMAVVDRWIADLAGRLHEKFPAFSPARRQTVFKPTCDIDIAYAYRHKGLLRTAGGILKSCSSGLWDEMSEDIRRRWRVLTGREKDPYDTFDALQQLHRDEGLHPVYFVLFAPRSRYDKGISPEKPAFRLKIMSLAQEAEIGIHASYAASSEKEPLRLLSEKEALATLIQRKVTANRFHYLHFRLPESCRMLLQAGITEDYSMGYADTAGFRAGTCNPFYFFDLERNENTPLRIHPLLFMENAFFKEPPDIQMSVRIPFKGYVPLYDQKPPEAAELFEAIRPLLDECIRFNGEIVTLFHNQSFGELPGHDLPVPALYSKIIHYIKCHAGKLDSTKQD